MLLLLCVFVMTATAAATTLRGRVAGLTVAAFLFVATPFPAFLPGAWQGSFGAGDASASVASIVTSHLHLDHLGSVQVVTNSVGNVLQSARYRVFGKTRWSSGTGVERTFTGHVDDTDAQLIYMNARHYDPEIGTFLTFDPSDQYASPYTYAGNNPVGVIDPTGTSLLGVLAPGMARTSQSLSRVTLYRKRSALV